MTKANAAPKVTYVKPGQFEPETPKAKAQTPADSYKPAGSDPFKAIVNGSPKAESIAGGVLSEIFEADSTNTRQRNGYYDGIQDLLGSMMISDIGWKPPVEQMADIPYVPDLQKDIISKGAGCVQTMEPVVARYAGLEKVLVTMIDVATKSMHPNNMSKMRADEYRSMQAYRNRLHETLRECRLQRSRAEKYLEKQRAKQAAGIW